MKIIITIILSLFSSVALSSNGVSWGEIPGGKVVDGKYQITCGEGTGWQKCGTPPPQNCTYNSDIKDGTFILNNMFAVVGDPNGIYAPSNIKSLPYTFKPNIFVLYDGGAETFSGYLADKTVTKMKPIPGDVMFTSAPMKGHYDPYVENLFTSKFGNSFLDVSDLKVKTNKGTTVFPGRLRGVYDLEGQSYSGFGLATWYMHEICIED